jgi:hypothetical protein
MPKAERSAKACCLVSELLEETGIDREKARALKRQVLEGVVLLCQWQLARMTSKPRSSSPPPGKRGRKIVVE